MDRASFGLHSSFGDWLMFLKSIHLLRIYMTFVCIIVTCMTCVRVLVYYCNTWCDMFTVWQIKDKLFLEDISNLLNSGEVPDIFDSGDKMRESDKWRDKSVQVRFFINCVRTNDSKLTVDVHTESTLQCKSWLFNGNLIILIYILWMH